jgi:hypothetical protein
VTNVSTRAFWLRQGEGRLLMLALPHHLAVMQSPTPVDLGAQPSPVSTA